MKFSNKNYTDRAVLFQWSESVMQRGEKELPFMHEKLCVGCGTWHTQQSFNIPNIPYMLTVITLHIPSRGVISLYVCIVIIFKKSPDLQIYVSVRDVITTNPEISRKNCLLYSSNWRTWFTSSTNHAFFPSACLWFAGQLV